MFEDSLPPDIDVLAVTAADATEPSFACFYDAELGTFLADVFSISWMEDSESGGRESADRVWLYQDVSEISSYSFQTKLFCLTWKGCLGPHPQPGTVISKILQALLSS